MDTALGSGIYTYSEAARYVGCSTQRVRAMFLGWRRGAGAVLSSDYEQRAQLVHHVSFLDLIEALVVDNLRARQVSLGAIRRAYEHLGEYFGKSHPFSHQKLLTDAGGKRIFVHREGDGLGDDELIEIVSRQHAIPKVLLPYLKQIDYDPQSGYATRWNISKGVVLDPRRKYGKPIVEACGIPTEILAAAYGTCKEFERVADWYGVLPEDVKRAVEFEQGVVDRAA